MLGKCLITEPHPQQRVNRRKYLSDNKGMYVRMHLCIRVRACVCVCAHAYACGTRDWCPQHMLGKHPTTEVHLQPHMFISYPLISKPRIKWTLLALRGSKLSLILSKRWLRVCLCVAVFVWYRLEKWIILLSEHSKTSGSGWEKNMLPFGQRFLLESERVICCEWARLRDKPTSLEFHHVNGLKWLQHVLATPATIICRLELGDYRPL